MAPPAGDLNLVDVRTRLDRGEIIGEVTLTQIFDLMTDLLVHEENLVIVQSPVIICGDIHGQYEDLRKLFDVALTPVGGDIRAANFLFMGDYVDRGKFSLNTILLLFSYKIENPRGFTLLRGNHECRQVTQQYGFQEECMALYGHDGIWARCMDVFDLLPIAALTDREIFSVHGGLSPDLTSPVDVHRCKRQREIPENGVIADLTWSDPADGNVGWRPNTRGAGFVFGREPTERFCHLNSLRLVTRSHQVVQEGFQWFFDGLRKPGCLINVWSAPRYPGHGDNKASVLRLRFDGYEEFNLPVFGASEHRIDMAKRTQDPSWYFA
jgi:diadenosine tetraphosphatase ApaH/serine/threonine PP2A family protein phosphatase